MTLRKIIFFISLIISSVISIVGFFQINFWIGEIAVLISAILWFFIHKKNPYLCLLLSIIIAVTGILLNITAIFMLLYAGLSILCWDLALFDMSLKQNDKNYKSSFYQILRLISVGISLGAGFVIIFLGKLLNIRIHFFIIVILVVIITILIDKIIHLLHKKE